MESTNLNSLISSLSGNAEKTANVKLYNEIRTHLRSPWLTCNDRKKVIDILKDNLCNGSSEENREVLNVIIGICTEYWPENITSDLFSILITEKKLHLEECLCAQNDWATRSKILESVVKSSASIPLKIFLYFIHDNVVRSVFMTKNETIRTLLSEFVLTLSSNYGIQKCDPDMQQKSFELFKKSYVPIIEDLRKNDNRVWYRLCMFTLSYFGKLIHPETFLINTLLSNIEQGFKSKNVEDKLLSFECWKVLIDVASLDHNYMCSSKHLKLLVKPLQIKLSTNDQVTCKRLEVWSYLLAALQENSTASLENFMSFCYEPLPANMWSNGHPAWSDVIKQSWSKRTEILMNLIGHYGHDGSCILPETFKLDSPIITAANLLKYKTAILNALSMCSENMLFWEVKSAREKKIKCLWGSVFKIISSVDLMTKETVLRDIFVILKKFFEKSQNEGFQDYFDDILQHVFSVISSDQECNFSLINDLIVFPLAEVMVGYSDLLEYKVITFMKFFRNCSKTGSRLEYFNRSCDLLKTYHQCSTQMLSAYIWLELSNELLGVCKAPRDEFDQFKDNALFLMTWIWQSYMPENLEQKIFDRWKSILVEINVISDTFKENLLEEIEKLLKENLALSSKILGFLYCTSNVLTEKSTIKFVTKLLDVVFECVKNPCLQGAKLRNIVPLITKFQNHISKTDKNKAEKLAIKLFQCIECLLKPHQAYEILKLFKTMLPKLPQSVKKSIPATLQSIISDLTTHSDAIVAQDAITLLTELERSDTGGGQTFVKPLVSTRTAKMMSNGNVANMFAQEVLKSPVRVKGSQIANKVQSKTMKIANAMPLFKSPKMDLDGDSSDFVFIDKEVKFDRSKLSAHQKEALAKRREDIPALYQDLSQSQNDSLSKGSSCTADEEIIKNDFKDVVGSWKTSILDKFDSQKIEPLNKKEQAKSSTKKRARLSLKTTSNSKSEEFTDDDVLVKEQINAQPVVLVRRNSDPEIVTNSIKSNLSKAKSSSLENLDLSPKASQNSVFPMLKESRALPTTKEDQVSIPSDADETLCSQAIEAANSENTPKSDKKRSRRRVTELSKIKMDIVGADEFVGLGRKRRSVQKVLENFVSPFKTDKKTFNTKESQASEPLIPPIAKAKTPLPREEKIKERSKKGISNTPEITVANTTNTAAEIVKKRGRRTKGKLHLNTSVSYDKTMPDTAMEQSKKNGKTKEDKEKSKCNETVDNKTNSSDIILDTEDLTKSLAKAQKKAGRPGLQSSKAKSTENVPDCSGAEVDEAISNNPLEAVKRRSSRPSLQSERGKSENLPDSGGDIDDKAVKSSSLEAVKRRKRRFSAGSERDKTTENLPDSGGDTENKATRKTPMEAGKRRSSRHSLQSDRSTENLRDSDGDNEDKAIMNTQVEPSKRDGSGPSSQLDGVQISVSIAYPETPEPLDHKQSRKTMSDDADQRNDEVVANSLDILNSEDKTVSNSIPSEHVQRGREKSLLHDDDKKNYEITDGNATNTTTEVVKRRGRPRKVNLHLNASASDDKMLSNTAMEQAKKRGKKKEDQENNKHDGTIDNTRNTSDILDSEDLTETAKAQKKAGRPGLQSDKAKSTENIPNSSGTDEDESISNTPLEVVKRRSRRPSLQSERCKSENLPDSGGDIEDKAVKSCSLEAVKRRKRRFSAGSERDESTENLPDSGGDTENKTTGNSPLEAVKRRSRRLSVQSDRSTENLPDSGGDTEDKTIKNTLYIKIQNLATIDTSDITKETKAKATSKVDFPDIFKEPHQKLQKTDKEQEMITTQEDDDDDECIIESSQPVETSIYSFNRSNRKSFNLKGIENAVSEDVFECIIGDRFSPSDQNKDGLRSNTSEISCDVTASCNPDESVASVQAVVAEEKMEEIENREAPIDRELFPVRRDNILIDLDLDALPMGFDAFEKENLPGSPVSDDITHRNSELLNSTLDISPIIVTKEETDDITAEDESGRETKTKGESEEEITTTPLSTPTKYMKTASSRSAKLMNMLPNVQRLPKSPKSLVRRTQASITSSPTTDRIKRMMLKCNDTLDMPTLDQKGDGGETLNVLEFTRDVPSPYATPNGSILKRKACEALDSPLLKRKRVNFSDPPTTCEKIYFKEMIDEDSADGIAVISELNVKKSSPVYPPLTECTIGIKEVLTHVRQENLLEHFHAVDIKTVGDLAKLNSSQINQLEFLNNPRLSTITQALSAFADRLLSNANHETSPPRDDEIPEENSESQGSCKDVMDGLTISNKALKMWSDLKILCNNKELKYIYNDLKKTLKE